VIQAVVQRAVEAVRAWLAGLRRHMERQRRRVLARAAAEGRPAARLQRMGLLPHMELRPHMAQLRRKGPRRFAPVRRRAEASAAPDG